MLRVVPKCRHRVPVVIAHGQQLRGCRKEEPCPASFFRACQAELVQQPAVERLLLQRIVVGVIAGRRLTGSEPEGIRASAQLVRIIRQQSRGQSMTCGVSGAG